MINYVGVPGTFVTALSSTENYQRLAYLIDQSGPVVDDPENAGTPFSEGYIAVMSAGDNGEQIIDELSNETGVGNAIVFNTSLRAQGRMNVAPAGFEPSGFQIPDFVVYAKTNSQGNGRVGGVVAALLQTPGELATDPVAQVHSQRPEVIKALLMAGATKDYHDFEALRNDQSSAVTSNNQPDGYYQPHVWERISDGQPLDPEYGAGLLNIDHSYRVLQAGEQGHETNTSVDATGWDYNTLSAEGTRQYTFTLTTAQSVSAALTWNRKIEATEGTHDGQGNTLTAATFTPRNANLKLALYQVDGLGARTLIQTSDMAQSTKEYVYSRSLPAGEYVLVVGDTGDTTDDLGTGEYADNWRFALAWDARDPDVPDDVVVTTSDEGTQVGTLRHAIEYALAA